MVFFVVFFGDDRCELIELDKSLLSVFLDDRCEFTELDKSLLSGFLDELEKRLLRVPESTSHSFSKADMVPAASCSKLDWSVITW